MSNNHNWLRSAIVVINQGPFIPPDNGFYLPYYIECSSQDISKWKEAIVSVWVNALYNRGAGPNQLVLQFIPSKVLKDVGLDADTFNRACADPIRLDVLATYGLNIVVGVEGTTELKEELTISSFSLDLERRLSIDRPTSFDNVFLFNSYSWYEGDKQSWYDTVWALLKMYKENQ